MRNAMVAGIALAALGACAVAGPDADDPRVPYLTSERLSRFEQSLEDPLHPCGDLLRCARGMDHGRAARTFVRRHGFASVREYERVCSRVLAGLRHWSSVRGVAATRSDLEQTLKDCEAKLSAADEDAERRHLEMIRDHCRSELHDIDHPPSPDPGVLNGEDYTLVVERAERLESLLRSSRGASAQGAPRE